MSTATLHKAQEIYKAGGVERTGASSFRVLSTSGETYGVWTSPAYCTCPAAVTCSHQAAVDIHQAKRRAA